MAPTATKPFDSDAQAHIAGLFRTCPPEDFLSELRSYAPRSGPEHVASLKYEGWAVYDAGGYRESRPYLARGLQWSDGGSVDRSLMHGLLSESYLRVGEIFRAERCARRALWEGCGSDPGHFLEAGHLYTMGRIQSLSGHVTQAVETFHRAIALLDLSSPHWINSHAALAEAHLFLGDLAEADAAIREARKGLGSAAARQEWGIAPMECTVAMALGEVDRAERVVDDTVRRFSGKCGERVQFILMESQATVLRARGRHGASEALLRAILSRAVLGDRNSDAVSTASRNLAETLMAQGRHAEALDACRLAARAGRMDNRVEWVRALRLKGECFLGLGAAEEARSAFREARSVHATTQFRAEWARLEESIRRADLRGVVSSDGLSWNVKRKTWGLHRLPLRSGRVFLSCDRLLVEAIRSAAQTDLPVLIEGETGTGKELVAHLIHELGPLSKGPLVVVDCTSLPESLADVELFGAARGAYTGAFRERAGLIPQADGGTILLDELPELTTALQSKLLRAIQEGTYRRVGEDWPRRVQVRFIATTNQSTQKLLDSGALKKDLYYRLSGHRILLRPLRLRREEIAPLAAEVVKASGLGPVARDALQFLEAQSWPGNVRQLEMVVRLAAASSRPGATLQRRHLEPHLKQPETSADVVSLGPHGGTLHAYRHAGERALLEQALAASGGVVTRAARSLHISRQSFYKAMRRTGLK